MKNWLEYSFSFFAFHYSFSSGMSVNQDISKVSQQRDCPGFAPDSLLIRVHEYEPGTNSAAKIEINSNAGG